MKEEIIEKVMSEFEIIYTDIMPSDADVVKVISPENYTVLGENIEPTVVERFIMIPRGAVIYAKRRKTDPHGLYYLAFSRNQSYWNFCVCIGHTKLEDEILKQLKQKKIMLK